MTLHQGDCITLTSDENLYQVIGVDDQHNQRIHLRRQRGRILMRMCAVGGDRCKYLGTHVAGMHDKARTQQRAGDTQAHRAKAHDADGFCG